MNYWSLLPIIFLIVYQEDIRCGKAEKKKENTYLIDLEWTFAIESLSMLLMTKSLLREYNVPSDTFTGMRTTSATAAIGTKIFKLLKITKVIILNFNKYQIMQKRHLLTHNKSFNTKEKGKGINSLRRALI